MILNVPPLSSEAKDKHYLWMESFVRPDLPNLRVEPKLFNFVKTFQIYNYSKTCPKYKNKNCRFFHF